MPDQQLAAIVRFKVDAANKAIRDAQEAGLHVNLRVVALAGRPFRKELRVKAIERFMVWEDGDDEGDHNPAVSRADGEPRELQQHEG